VVFFFVPFTGAMVTYILVIHNVVLRLGLLFSSGLFFAMGVMHLTGDSVAGFQSLEPNDGYPYGLFMVVSGFFFALLSDITVHAIWERKEEREAQRLPEKVEDANKQKLSCCKDAEAEPALEGEKCSGVNCNCDGNSCRCSESWLAERSSDKSLHTLSEFPFVELIFLLLAMCFHAIFEGLAVGLTTSVYGCWNLTLTIVLHKFFEGTALGSALKQQNRKRPWWSYVLYASLFSIMAPIGCAIGIILDSSVEPVTASWVQAIGNGFAAGVFIFVAVCQLMAKGLKRRAEDKWWTPFVLWLFTALGASTFSCLELRQS